MSASLAFTVTVSSVGVREIEPTPNYTVGVPFTAPPPGAVAARTAPGERLIASAVAPVEIPASRRASLPIGVERREMVSDARGVVRRGAGADWAMTYCLFCVPRRDLGVVPGRTD